MVTMFSSRTYSLVFLSFFIIATFFTLSHGDLSSARFSRLSGARREKYETENYSRRIAVETSTDNSTYMILAARRTYRRDPLDNNQYYKGGWNLTNPNYIHSLIYSASGPMFAGVGWFVVFGICLLCMCCCNIWWSPGKNDGSSRVCFFIGLFVLTVFAIVVLCGTGIIYNSEQKFHKSLVDTSSYLLGEGNILATHLSDLGKTLATAKDLGATAEFILPEEQKAQIEQAQLKLTNVTEILSYVTERGSSQIHILLEPMRLLLFCLTGVVLATAALGFVFCVCGWGCLLNCLVIFGWILMFGIFFVSGFFLLVNNSTGDTCVAIDDWLQNPTATTALEDVIPKVNGSIAEQMINVSKNVTFSSISAINTYIANVSNVDVPPQAGPPLYYNQSGPKLPLLCNPYNSDFTDRQCANYEVTLEKASEVWRIFVCQVSDKDICTTPGRLTPSKYDSLTTSLNVANSLNVGRPFLADLLNSTYLKNILGRLRQDYCPNLVKYSSWMYVGFITTTVGLMLSVVIWLIATTQKRNRHHKKKVDKKKKYYLWTSIYLRKKNHILLK